MGIGRAQIMRQDREDAEKTKAVNSVRKRKERHRRDARMAEILKSGELPYTPVVMSWLSRKLSKPAGQITQDDVRKVLV